MSRYALSSISEWDEVEFGWDPTGFFLQCSHVDDDEPAVWLVALNLDALAEAMKSYAAFELPDLARRALDADSRNGHTIFVEGDPVIWRSSSGEARRGTIVDPHPSLPEVRFENGDVTRPRWLELDPDLSAFLID